MFSRVRVSAVSVIGEFSHGCASACAGLSRRRASVTSSFEIRSFALRTRGNMISYADHVLLSHTYRVSGT